MDTASEPAAALPSPRLRLRRAMISRRWLVVFLLFAVSLINYFDRASISIALPLIAKEFHLDSVGKGVLLSAFFWSYALMQIPIGWCADRFNLRWLYAGAFLLWSIAQALMGFAGNFAALIRLRILLGIGESIYLPGGTKVVSLLFSAKECGLPFGLFDFGTRTGLVLEGLIVPWMVNRLGWRDAFVAIGFSAMLWLVPWWIVAPKNLRSARRVDKPKAPAWRHAARLLTNRNLLGICLGFFCFDYYWYLLVMWLPDYLYTVRHFTLLKAGFFSALPYFVFGVSEPIGGWAADALILRGASPTLTRKWIVTIAFSTGLLLIPASRVSSPSTAVALIIAGCLVGLATGNLLVILQSCAPAEEVALWTGVENFVGNLGGVLAPILTAFLIKKTGSYAPGFGLAAAVLIVGMFAYWFIVGELKSDPAPA